MYVNGQSNDAAVALWGRSTAWLFGLLGLGILIAVGSFDHLLSGRDLTLPVEEYGRGSLLSQFVRAAFYSLAAILLVTSGHARNSLTAGWPIFILPCLALLSTLWAPDVTLTLRRSVALLGTILFGFSLASILSLRQCVSLVITALTGAMLLSIIWVVAFPKFGIHQAEDAVQAVHMGLWRGIFPHRNFLGGYVGGILLAFLLLYGRYAFYGRSILHIVALVATLACLVGSNSGAGYAVAAITTIAGVSLIAVATAPVGFRLPLIILLASIFALLIVLGNEVLSLGLWLLGKDPGLTGRVEIWSTVVALMNENTLLGRGYFSGFHSISEEIGTGTQDQLSSAHNGYLDLLIYFGYVGFAAAVVSLGWLLFGGIRSILDGPRKDGVLNTFPLCILVFVVAHNVVESSLVAPNTSVPFLLGVAAGSLVRQRMKIQA